MHDLITSQIQKIADAHSVVFDDNQLHVGDERAIMSPHKFVFTGTDTTTGSRVVLKCSNHPDGIAEMYSEHIISHTLQSLPFSEELLNAPRELFYGTKHGYTVGITEFIEQNTVFSAHTLQEQFFMALQSLEAQEAFHATTSEHRGYVRDSFTIHSPVYYQETTAVFTQTITNQAPQYTDLLKNIVGEINSAQQLLSIYDGYLIHTDFVPHNFRIAKDHVYLLDFSSFRLGNKYESWARFVNFMEVHSPELVPLLVNYVDSDRGAEEANMFRLMRLHKALFLAHFYTNNIQKTSGDMQKLAQMRLDIWMKIIDSLYHTKDSPIEEINRYRVERNTLRSETEKARQQEFTLL